MIGGNQNLQLQIYTNQGKNEIGESIGAWETVQTLGGFLDLSSGDSNYSSYNAKVQESTHIFIATFATLDSRIKAENCRALDEDGLVYDVTLIDDPMKLHKHLEIYLKYTGVQ